MKQRITVIAKRIDDRLTTLLHEKELYMHNIDVINAQVEVLNATKSEVVEIRGNCNYTD